MQGHTRIPNIIVESSLLTPEQLAVYLYMRRFDPCYISYQHIADRFKHGRRWAIKRVQELLALGLIKRTRRSKNKKASTNLYFFTKDDELTTILTPDHECVISSVPRDTSVSTDTTLVSPQTLPSVSTDTTSGVPRDTLINKLNNTNIIKESTLLRFSVLDPDVQSKLTNISQALKNDTHPPKSRSSGPKGQRPKKKKGFDSGQEKVIDEILGHLKQKTNGTFRLHAETNRGYLRQRLQEKHLDEQTGERVLKYSPELLKDIVDEMCRQWIEIYPKNLNPVTLFRKTNCARYAEFVFERRERQEQDRQTKNRLLRLLGEGEQL